MRQLFFTIALAMPMSLLAEEAADTTIVYNGKQIVISDDAQETRVSVFTQDSTQMVKSSETKFVNKQEIERIYVSSPFFPTSTTRLYASMYPTLWWGTSSLSTQIGRNENTTSREGLHARGGFEVGFTTAEGVYPLSKRGEVIFSNAVQMVYSRHNFQNSALLTGDCHGMGFEDRTHAQASANYMTYGSLRLPLMLGWAPSVNWQSDWLDTQFGLALVPEYRFGKARYVFEPEAFGESIEQKMRLYHWGLNVDVNMVLGPVKFSIYMGLLPIFKTTEGKKAYCSSLNFGINIGELFGKRSQNGSF